MERPLIDLVKPGPHAKGPVKDRRHHQPDPPCHQRAPRLAGSALGVPTVRPQADAEFRAKCAVEIRDIAETAVERDIKNGCRFQKETRCRSPKTQAQQVLMRRHSGQSLECPEEMDGLSFASRARSASLTSC
jgi:hypothetical protein